MGIETSTYRSREVKQPSEGNKDYEKGFINGVRALYYHQLNEQERGPWEGIWSELVSH
jgi:hypothetical protein